MNFTELIKTRYSLRSYSDKLVDKTTINTILKAAIIAPTAANRQSFHIVVVDDNALLEKIRFSYQRDWFADAKQVLVILGNHTTSWKRADNKDHCEIDVAIVVDHMTLMAAELGVGSCWICNFDAKIVSEALKLPSHFEPTVLLPIGYPKNSDIPQKKRMAMEELVSWNSI